MRRLAWLLPLALTGCVAMATGAGTAADPNRGTAEVSFSASVGTNANGMPLTGNARGSYANGTSVLSVTSGSTPATARVITVLIHGGKPVVGKTYPVTDAAKAMGHPDLVSVQYAEAATRAWESTGGVCRVDAFAGNRLTVAFENVTMGTPNTTTANPATGTFTLNGTATFVVTGL